MDAVLVGRALETRPGQQRLDLGAEHEAFRAHGIGQRLLAHAVARQNQAPRLALPDRDGEHARQPLEHRQAPLLVAEQDRLGVALGAEFVARRFEIAADILEIVDFAVEDDVEQPVGLVHRLVGAGRGVDDGEAGVREADLLLAPDRAAVGPAVVENADHGLRAPRLLRIRQAVPRRCHKARKTAHVSSFSSRCLSSTGGPRQPKSGTIAVDRSAHSHRD